MKLDMCRRIGWICVDLCMSGVCDVWVGERGEVKRLERERGLGDVGRGLKESE